MQLSVNICLDGGRDENLTCFLSGATSLSGCSASNLRKVVVSSLLDRPTVGQAIESLRRATDQLRRAVANPDAYGIHPLARCAGNCSRIHSETLSSKLCANYSRGFIGKRLTLVRPFDWEIPDTGQAI
jgi:hypothetical protein